MENGVEKYSFFFLVLFYKGTYSMNFNLKYSQMEKS